ncbi:MAG: S9 family peptidase [Actinobacteria bacterium]|nr:S9 family peptidase [Actinomycetota bacterium]
MFSLVLSLLVLTCLGGCGGPPGKSARGKGGITAEQLVAPNALMGPGPSSLQWSPVASSLTYVEPQDGRQVLMLYDAPSGEKSVLLDPADHEDDIDVTSAQWSDSGESILLVGEKSFWVLRVGSRDLEGPLAEGEAGKTSMMFLPGNDYVSYVQDNDIYTVRVSDGEVRRLTADGSDTVYNGTLDWVYTEELATRAAQPGYAWSPDGKWLMYLRLDDSRVQNHPVTDYDPVPPTVSHTRYPTAGSDNPAATLYAIALEENAETKVIPLPEGTEYVLPFFAWTPDSSEALFITENRDHTVLALNAWDRASGNSRTLIEETDKDWVNEYLYTAPMFVDGGRSFLWLSERDGFMHLYRFSRAGELEKQLTSGDWLIDSNAYDILTPSRPVHVNREGTLAYFSATRDGPLERQVYRLDIETGKLRRVSKGPGFHSAALSGDGEYLWDQYSGTEKPPITAIYREDGSEAKVLAECAGPSLDLPGVKREFLKVRADDGVELSAQMVKPANFDPDKRYGVVVHWYGGPSLQLIQDRYGPTGLFQVMERDVLYTQEGLIVWRLDNRGSYGRGHAFETPIEGHLGPAALSDQLAGIDYLRSLPYVDGSRIGCDGHSFGGFLTLYAMVHEPRVFKCGVSGSPPTDWKYYDTIYTERYMKTPQQNPQGYSETEVISRAKDLAAEPLIIHGLADTNVHLQNSINFMQALEAADKAFIFVPLPNQNHDYEGNGMVTALSDSAEYIGERLSGTK